jgi:uncharacterized protein (DUF433 family)
MATLPSNQYVELRNGRHYYVAGTRIGLDVLIYAFRDGKAPEDIFKSYPAMGSLAKVYGAITFILEHPEAVEVYLQDQKALWDKFREEHPIPEHLLERLRSAPEVTR